MVGFSKSAPAIVMALAVAGCGRQTGSQNTISPWPPTPDQEVVGENASEPDLHLNVYLDGTVSMQGFVADGHSHYARFLQDLEGTALGQWSSTDVQYFKFGSRIRKLTNRQEFLEATSKAFYVEHGMAETTDIDTVLAQLDLGRLNVIVSDLFEADGDVNPLVDKLKNRLLRTGAAVGVLAIPSEFDGTVYDAGVQPFPYKAAADPAAERPFYAVILGREEAITRLVQALSRQDYVHSALFVLVARHIVSAGHAVVTRGKNVTAITGTGDFRWNANESPAELVANVSTTVRPGVPAFDVSRLDVSVEEATGNTSTPTTLVRATGTSGTASAFTIDLHADSLPDRKPHDFHVTVRLASDGGYILPAWVNAWSAATPAPGHDPNRTRNLDRLISTLLQASVSVDRPVLSRFRFSLRSR